MQALMDKIALVTHEGGEWCSVEKAHRLATMIAALRPSVIVEIGVWMGGSLVPMALACKHVGHGRIIAIDPWSKSASVAGMDATNAHWWGQINHDQAYRHFLSRLDKHELGDIVKIIRSPSDDVVPPSSIDLLHVDGNHSDQAIRDVERFSPNVRSGGLVVMDDVGWIGGNVSRACQILLDTGFVKLYDLGTGSVFQRKG